MGEQPTREKWGNRYGLRECSASSVYCNQELKIHALHTLSVFKGLRGGMACGPHQFTRMGPFSLGSAVKAGRSP